MHENEVVRRAFAMPLTSPAYPPGPYRFVNREYLIITYRTDPAKLRSVVPAPLELDEREALVKFIRMPDSQWFWRLHRERPSHPGVVPRSQGRLRPLHVPER
jgi:acetoacetate decarboxylase